MLLAGATQISTRQSISAHAISSEKMVVEQIISQIIGEHLLSQNNE